ncbi:TetR/AcrR family transcriptional regulator C-terminal domain-containing protein [Kitasatospora sp. NBC_00085]|uniref:TetR/AcrR family transcriptional regulator n=1 Tax=unclassified Kitasatospora TaxID=2633591 RepID=UPI003246D910
MPQQTNATARRTNLNRDRVLRAAVARADRSGIEALSMRSLAQELGVVPMALYKHVANKEELLDGMVDAVIAEIGEIGEEGEARADSPADASAGDAAWKGAARRHVLAARHALLRHPWAARVIESRTGPTPGILGYLDSLIGTLLAGGLSADLTHHAMHALGSRAWGFTQELLPTAPSPDPQVQAAALRELAVRFPHIAEIATVRPHDDGTVVGQGCDDQFEFEFALDLLLDGFERLHRQGWSSAGRA